MIVITNADKNKTGEDVSYDPGYVLPDKEYKVLQEILDVILVKYCNTIVDQVEDNIYGE